MEECGSTCGCKFQKKVLKKLKKIQKSVDCLSQVSSVTYTLGNPGNPSGGNIIQIPFLKGKIILAVFVDGALVSTPSDYTYNINTGDFDFTIRGGVTNTSVMNIIYK